MLHRDSAGHTDASVMQIAHEEFPLGYHMIKYDVKNSLIN